MREIRELWGIGWLAAAIVALWVRAMEGDRTGG